MFKVGQQIGIYTLLRKLGQGGFGEVWLAEKTSGSFRTFSKKVALKLPHSEQVDFSSIEKEANLWEQASGHPNVLPIIDADVFDGQVVIVSEFADGGSLADKLVIEGKLPVKKAVELAIGILNGLQYLHSKGIIHRDIKPQNILLQGNTPRLADFGISRAMNTTNFSTAIVGTDAYMSPEALDGNRSEQTDIWSVGVVIYQMLQGELPFSQVHRSERMFAILSKEYTPLSADIPQRLHQIIAKSLAKNPAERFSFANEMIENLNNFTTEISRLTYLPTEQILKDEKVVSTFLNNPPLPITEAVTFSELPVSNSQIKPTAASFVNFNLPTDEISPHSKLNTEPASQVPVIVFEKPRKFVSSQIIIISTVLMLMFAGTLIASFWILTNNNRQYGLPKELGVNSEGAGSRDEMGGGNGRGTGEGTKIGLESGNSNGNGNGNGATLPPPVAKPKPAVTTAMRITSKPRASYTDAARQNNVQGTVTLRVTFLASGQIGSISPVSGLPYGLTEQAIVAARGIRFEPQMVNGQPQSVTKSIQYSFTIY